MNIIKTFSAMSGLSAVHRFSMMKLGNPESVLEHVGFVAVLSNLIARELNVIRPGTIDVAEMTLKALVHDLDELVVGDIPRPTKYHSEKIREEFRRIERWGVAKVAKELQLSETMQARVIDAHAAAKDDVDGMIVDMADILAVAYKVWEEVIIRGNASLVRQSRSVVASIEHLTRRIGNNLEDEDQKEFLVEMLRQVHHVMGEAASYEHPLKEIMVP